MEQVPLSDIKHGDVVQDPKSGKWLTVTRIVAGDVAVDGRVSERFLAFYGDERLDEQIVFDDPDGMVNREL